MLQFLVSKKREKPVLFFFNTGFFDISFSLSSELSNLMVFSSPVLDRWSNNSFNKTGPLSRHKKDLESNYKPHLSLSAFKVCPAEQLLVISNTLTVSLMRRQQLKETGTTSWGKMALSKAHYRLYGFCRSKTTQGAFSIFLKTVSIFFHPSYL